MKRLPLVLVLLWLGGCTACNPTTEPPKPRENQPNVKWCPGSPGCLAEGETQLLAGAGRKSITLTGFEIANPAYLTSTGDCDPIYLQRFGVNRCGELPDDRPRNCGTDGICPGAMDYPGPDGDGTENDQGSFRDTQDWFFDCGLDRICPPMIGGRVRTVPQNTPEPEAVRSNGVDDDGDGAIDEGEYPGPDEGEMDSNFQAAWIAGFGNNRPALGVLDDQQANCLALRTNQTTVVHCTIDVVGFFYEEIVRAREKLAQNHPNVDVDYLAVSSTHTHETVDTMGQWGRADPVPILPGRFPGYNAFIVDQIVLAAVEAVNSLQPARLVMTTAHTGVDGYLRDSRDPQILDDAMTLVEAQSVPARQTIFTAIHWSNHPEVLSDEINFLSSDYAATLRTRVEQGFPDLGLQGRGGIAIYINGTVGGLMTPLGIPVTGRDGTVWPSGNSRIGRVVAYGENLAIQALQALSTEANLTVAERGEIKVKAERYFIPVKNNIFVFAFATGLFDRSVFDEPTGLPIDTTVTSLLETEGSAATESYTIDVAGWSLLGVPGELFPEVATGGYDGTMRHGRELVRANYCPDQANCPANCPATRPAEGYSDCDCEQCRICVVPDLAAAPTAPYFKDRMPGAFKMVVGLANDELGYMVPPYDFRVSEKHPYFCQHGGDHYEETNSTGPGSVTRIENAAKKLFDFAL
jgi:hypothetical protein